MMGWPQWVMVAYLVINVVASYFREGMLSAKGQSAYLTATGVVTSTLIALGLVFTLYSGGFFA